MAGEPFALEKPRNLHSAHATGEISTCYYELYKFVANACEQEEKEFPSIYRDILFATAYAIYCRDKKKSLNEHLVYRKTIYPSFNKDMMQAINFQNYYNQARDLVYEMNVALEASGSIDFVRSSSSTLSDISNEIKYLRSEVKLSWKRFFVGVGEKVLEAIFIAAILIFVDRYLDTILAVLKSASSHFRIH